MIADIAWAIFTFACCVFGASMLLESTPRRKRSHLHLLIPHRGVTPADPTKPDTECNSQPPDARGKR